ncbi:hypothetical protein M422DRAFT_276740 [Sphaerobolus stellatus SS14]|uniref:Uncharacterized protein n=1 Tax=Sphaerobolus stellatus (strain SS14) TaxID=990650 RepID=A0A0C9U195_SPHS4|nr:hypothetical protein M422DRAFT_276740 [Sphaerobolus stellatus SS14]
MSYYYEVFNAPPHDNILIVLLCALHRTGRIRVFKADPKIDNSSGVYVSNAAGTKTTYALLTTTEDYSAALNVRVTALTDGVALWADNITLNADDSSHWLAVARSTAGKLNNQPKDCFPVTLVNTLDNGNTTVSATSLTPTEARAEAWYISSGESVDVLWLDDNDDNNYVYRLHPYVGSTSKLLVFSATGSLPKGSVNGTMEPLIPVVSIG